MEYNNPAVASNDQFQIELTKVTPHENLLTFTYQVCKLGTSSEVQDLRYWVWDWISFPYLAENMTMSDVYVNCGILDTAGNETCGLTVLDPATQIMGVKFDALRLGDGECQNYLVTLDNTALAKDSIRPSSVVVAAKAGNQNPTVPDGTSSGFAHMQQAGSTRRM